jgi:hypothetical protein
MPRPELQVRQALPKPWVIVGGRRLSVESADFATIAWATGGIRLRLGDLRPRSSFHPAGLTQNRIGPDHLRVHPAACGAGQERDDVGNVLRLPQPLERRNLAELHDLGLRLALQK